MLSEIHRLLKMLQSENIFMSPLYAVWVIDNKSIITMTMKT